MKSIAWLMVIFISFAIIVLLLVEGINKLYEKYNIRCLLKLTKTIGYIGAVMLYISIVILLIYVLITSMVCMYNVLNTFFGVVGINKIASYLSLSITLIFTAYFPDFFGRLIIRFFSFCGVRQYNFENLFKKLTKKLRLRVMIYVISVGLTVLSSINKLVETKEVVIPFIAGIQNVAIEAIITFIAVDTLISLIKVEIVSIKEEIAMVGDTFKFENLARILSSLGKDDTY